MSDREADDAGGLDGGYALSVEVHQRIEALYDRINDYRAYLRGESLVDPTLPQSPRGRSLTRVDPLVCALAIKAATSKRSIFELCEQSDGDNAIVLARVLLENACLLEWLTRGEARRRLESYAMFTSVVHERTVNVISTHKDKFKGAGAAVDDIKSSDYHLSVWQHVFVNQSKGTPTNSQRPTWEFERATKRGRPLNVSDLFTEVQGSFEYDVLYGGLGSDVVHSGPFSLGRMAHAVLASGKFVLRPMPMKHMRTIALASSNMAMFLVLDSFTQYIGLDLSAELELLKAKSKENSSEDPEP